MTSRHAPVRAAAATALAIAVFLAWLTAKRFVLSNDEGIFLEGSLRLLRGEVPYRDFFILMGPGSFWLQALALKTFGVSLAASRIVVIADLSVIAGCVCWVLARWTQPAYATWIAALMICLEVADPVMALPNHRWDSAACAILAATLAISREHPRLVFASGICAAFAAWITPSVALVGIALFAWFLIAERDRAAWFACGAAVISAICAAVLAFERALVPMLGNMLWTARNYSSPNAMPYGSRFGGYATLFAGASAADLTPRFLVVLALTMPAILPPLALAFSGTRAARKNREVLIFSIAGLALLASAYPRMDVPHLTYAAPFFYAIVAFHASRIPRRWARAAAFISACLIVALPLWYGISQRMQMIRVQTRVGEIAAAPQDAALIRELEQNIAPGDPVFCFPYLPMFYFLTLGRNPTRYSYLQPGMMGDADELAALDALRARPPRTVVYQDVTGPTLLRIWPRSDPTRLRMRRIEDFLSRNYHVAVTIPYAGSDFKILEQN